MFCRKSACCVHRNPSSIPSTHITHNAAVVWGTLATLALKQHTCTPHSHIEVPFSFSTHFPCLSGVSLAFHSWAICTDPLLTSVSLTHVLYSRMHKGLTRLAHVSSWQCCALYAVRLTVRSSTQTTKWKTWARISVGSRPAWTTYTVRPCLKKERESLLVT